MGLGRPLRPIMMSRPPLRSHPPARMENVYPNVMPGMSPGILGSHVAMSTCFRINIMYCFAPLFEGFRRYFTEVLLTEGETCVSPAPPALMQQLLWAHMGQYGPIWPRNIRNLLRWGGWRDTRQVLVSLVVFPFPHRFYALPLLSNLWELNEQAEWKPAKYTDIRLWLKAGCRWYGICTFLVENLLSQVIL